MDERRHHWDFAHGPEHGINGNRALEMEGTKFNPMPDPCIPMHVYQQNFVWADPCVGTRVAMIATVDDALADDCVPATIDFSFSRRYAPPRCGKWPGRSCLEAIHEQGS